MLFIIISVSCIEVFGYNNRGHGCAIKTVGVLFRFIAQYYYQGDNGTLNNAVGNIFLLSDILPVPE